CPMLIVSGGARPLFLPALSRPMRVAGGIDWPGLTMLLRATGRRPALTRLLVVVRGALAAALLDLLSVAGAVTSQEAALALYGLSRFGDDLSQRLLLCRVLSLCLHLVRKLPVCFLQDLSCMDVGVGMLGALRVGDCHRRRSRAHDLLRYADMRACLAPS